MVGGTGTSVFYIGLGMSLDTSFVVVGATIEMARCGTQFEGSIQGSKDLVENNSSKCG